ncbi:CHAT domain-containing protein [Streptomyces armeniacus]|uniref:CHAT domain-containing protein n=1 Tax=Streptomyces armeniacus TaxID=83291 RepID=A0A345XVV1_9ACTN|nr:CHAT domain-containing protein [Streptomyces armeniacus]AXK35767.1 CHAT domain-containing protein [Streptomyces armeniacus]
MGDGGTPGTALPGVPGEPGRPGALPGLPGLAEVTARLERVRRTGDPAPVLEPASLAAAHRLTRAVRQRYDTDALRARHPLGCLHWTRANALGPKAGEEDRTRAVQAFAVCFVAGIDDLPGELMPGITGFAARLTLHDTLGVADSYDADLITKVIWMWERIESAVAPGDPRLPVYVANLAFAARLRFQHEGSPADLSTALGAGRRSLRLAPPGHPERGLCLANLASALGVRYVRERTGEDLDLAVDLLRQAVEHTPAGHPNRAVYLGDLGGVLEQRYARDDDPADIDEAVTALREAARSSATGAKGTGNVLLNLGSALYLRYTITQDEADLDESLPLLRSALDGAPAGSMWHLHSLTSLGSALVGRYELRGDTGDVDEAVGLQRRAVAAAPVGTPFRRRALLALTYALYYRVVYGAPPELLDEAVDVATETRDRLAVSDAAYTACSVFLAEMLRMRYERAGDARDLAAARELCRVAPGSVAADDPAYQPAYQLAMAGVLFARALDSGSMADLDEVVNTYRAVLRGATAHGPQPLVVAGLAQALQTRFARTAAGADLDAAVTALREAGEQLPAADNGRPMLLYALGTALARRAAYRESAADAEAAADACESALRTAPVDWFHRHATLANWSGVLLQRFKLAGREADLDEAVGLARKAVRYAPAEGPSRTSCLHILGRVLLTRYRKVTSDASARDLDEALATLRQAHRDTPHERARRGGILDALGEALRVRFEHLGDASDRDAAVRAYEEAARHPSATPFARIEALVEAARLTAESDPVRAGDLYEEAVTLLPRVAPRQLYRGEQQRVLRELPGLASEAAALALSDTRGTPAGRAARAVQLLEAGRGVLMGQALDLRGGDRDELAALRQQYPARAARFESLRDRLDQPADATDTLMGTAAGGGTGDRHRLVADFETELAAIRKLPGFATFALPPPLGELLAEAREGAVVMLNVSSLRSDALVLTGSGVTALPLPGLGADAVTRQSELFQAAVHDANAAPDGRRRREAQRELAGVLGWLWDAAAEPVLAELGHGGAPRGGSESDAASDAYGSAWPRVWWVPCGPLSLLPVHAAGRHDEPGAAVLDRVVSSYTPTVRALRHARRPLPDGGGNGRPLVVAMPTTPGHAPLDHVPDEVAAVTARLAARLAGREEPGSEPPTRDAVLARLAGTPVAHFACHGETDAADPSQSRLFLHDHDSAPFTVGTLASVRLDHARLAYLSACRTAVTAGALSDEAIHLTAAFQLAGFRHVVGTLWQIVDDTAVTLADDFYAGLGPYPGPGPVPPPDRAAYALHAAVRALRARLPATPSLWAAHVHAGA